MSYFEGNKFIIELDEEISPGLWRAKGFRTLVFDEVGLKKLESAESALRNGFDRGYDCGSEAIVRALRGLSHAPEEEARELIKAPRPESVVSEAVEWLSGKEIIEKYKEYYAKHYAERHN